ncbi:TPA: hypothetical protein N0F65_005679 [Lagenidium giganteum]|uniref:N-acetyltransferase domain-containing protein n=1 Tax=Lagenidium giganteum TaxID=4803 RepID=A0AAV2ZCN9_9STRA|nr:TPA: hypothetical protein N0F65_005679 [Lagenidium giganteum]
MLRIVNCAIFPVRYSDSFYADILLTPPGYTKFAYVDGCAVGAICCRLEPIDSPSNPHAQRTYIMTLGILEPYRRCGLASRLLNSVVMQSRQDGIDHVYLHVQTSNSAALRFYQRFGFQVTDMIKNYYRRIEPPDCYVLTKALT